MTQQTAERVLRKDGKGEGWVYRISPPMILTIDPWIALMSGADPVSDDTEHTEYVWVSAAKETERGPETAIFPSDARGNIYADAIVAFPYLDHTKALEAEGYTVINAEEGGDPTNP